VVEYQVVMSSNVPAGALELLLGAE
jgi:hypothetical protein